MDPRTPSDDVQATGTLPTADPMLVRDAEVTPAARPSGRSLAADVRFDDATVSRRHALIVAQADGVRVLDDRSLNGVYVNGSRVEWSPLTDGDRIAVGRHTLWFLDTTAIAATPVATPVAAAD
jgi:predicted component of type VI protein secretion system